jgi:hypothetical protein
MIIQASSLTAQIVSGLLFLISIIVSLFTSIAIIIAVDDPQQTIGQALKKHRLSSGAILE